MQHGQFETFSGQNRTFFARFCPPFLGVRFGLQTMSKIVHFLSAPQVKNERIFCLFDYIRAFCPYTVHFCLHMAFNAICTLCASVTFFFTNNYRDYYRNISSILFLTAKR